MVPKTEFQDGQAVTELGYLLTLLNKGDDPKPLDDLSKALDHVSKLSANNTQTTVCVAGDFNAGDIDWETNCVTQGSQHTTLCNQLLRVLSENGLDHMESHLGFYSSFPDIGNYFPISGIRIPDIGN